MWRKKALMRHRFLHLELPKTEPRAVNQYVLDEYIKIAESRPPIQEMRSIQPVRIKMLNEDRANLAFGSWGLPKIIHEICSDDKRTQLCALNTLSELLLNSLECERAIREFEIVRRLQNTLIRRIIKKKRDQTIIPTILRCYGILACNLEAALQMAHRMNLIGSFYRMVESGDQRRKCSCILKRLTQHPQVVDYFIHETEWFDVLSDVLEDNFVGLSDANFLEHFSHFLELYPQLGLERGFFELILHEISEKQENQQILLKCFAFLLNCKEGQDKLDQCDGVRVLYEIFMDEELTTHEYVAQALQSATAASQTSLWRCKEFWDLPLALIRRAHVKGNEKQQLYCFKTLRQIATMPSVKKFLRKVCIPQIRSVWCRTEKVKQAKQQLWDWIVLDVWNR